ncbi:HCP-like protein [Gigaspora margarita]|uniref:HCP-like protein n=1 Tax=Gigaspora margarita TaxID=4874 RepID=A0A8H3WXH9_GIGMA|nr:HCP-like protein [Gigaspora margarita]
MPEPEIHSSYFPLEEGIRLHQSKQYKKAWQCFEENANLGNLKAKYWQAIIYIMNMVLHIYAKGKLQVQHNSKNRNLGLEYIRLAAKNGDKSEVWNDISDFISIYSTISQRPSDIESEQLFSLLKERKSDIDYVLNSYNVYAQCTIMNLKFSNSDGDQNDTLNANDNINDKRDRNNDSRDDENDGDDNNDNEGNDDNGGGSSGGSKSGNSSSSSGDNNENDDDNNSGDDNGSSDDNEINKKNKKMVISSESKVEFEDKKLIKDKKQFQNFNITIELWAKVDLKNYTKNNNSLTFEFKINLIQCGVTDLLSKLCLSLNSFTGYYINSLEICVSPIPSADNRTPKYT